VKMLWFRETGAGYPVVLLHAFPLDSEMWLPQVRLGNSRFRFICPDLPGFGKNKHSENITSIEQMAHEVLDLLNQLRIDKAVIGGLSMGGYVTFNLYRLAPEKFSAILLFDTSPLPDNDERRKMRFELIDEINQRGTVVLIEKMLPNLISESTKLNNPPLVEWLKNKFAAANSNGVIVALKAMANRGDHFYLLREIDKPALLLFGEFDKVTNLEIAEKMSSEIPNSKLFKIPDAGHYSNLENPHAFNHYLLSFLEEIL